MAGGKLFRQLNRDTAHRAALLRNLVTDLVQHESISTTYAKAKEAQPLAEQLITLAKRNTPASKRRIEEILFTPRETIPRLMEVLAPRYAVRQGGYTRVQRIEPLKTDQAESAILEFVDGPKDMRFALVAKTIANCKKTGHELSPITLENIKKVTQYRENGEEELEKEVRRFERMDG